MPASIPSIDLAQFVSGNAQTRSSFISQLGLAYEEVGFVSVKNHGVDQDLIDRFYAQVKTFFALPVNIKHQYEIPGLNGQRGYTSFGKEHAKHSPFGDLKEFYQFGQTVVNNDPVKGEYPANIAVGELPLFLDTAVELYRAFENCGRLMLSALALYLGLDEMYFDPHVHNGNSILRAIHYPPITGEPGSAMRSEQHEDINLITLLAGASADGLQVLHKQGSWIDVVTPPDHLVVNVGDMLQRLTNNKLRSTTHRVVNPPQAQWHTDRFSIPFFLHPRSSMRLDCLSSCIDEGHPVAYAPISAGEYLDERLIEIGLKK